ncbi:MAG TPA: sugar ABC transporter permease [Chloroflexi bacterium]|nr:sugar ABC transporter permease [Chloroflexota bacterium]
MGSKGKPFEGKRGARIKEAIQGYLYLLPATIIIFVFHLLPVTYAFYISLHKWKVKKVAFVAFQNYIKALNDPLFWNSLKVTVFYVVGTVPVTLILALIIAYLLFQKIQGRSIYRTVYFLPYITSTVASSAVWLWIFNPRHGPLNQFLEFIGLPPQRWLNEPRGIFEILGDALGVNVPKGFGGPSLALVSIMVFVIWFYVGYDATIFLAGLGSIPSELYEAAKIDGAGRWQLFRYITLPLLSPTIFFLTLVATIGSFQAFNHIYVMTSGAGGALGGPLHTTTTTTIYIFDTFYNRINIGYATAIAFLLFWLILGLTILQYRIGERRVFYG